MSWLLTYTLIEWLIRLGMVPVILRRRFDPPTALAWLGIIFLLPEFGLVLYLLVGVRHLGRKRVKLHRALIASMRVKQLGGHQAFTVRPEIDPALTAVVLQAERISELPILDGNSLELLEENDDFVNRLIGDIDAAVRHVHLLYYIFAQDQIGRRVTEALLRAAKRGVRCRLIADHAGSHRFFRRSGLSRELLAGGVEVVRALPAFSLRRRLARLDLRNHRKLAVIDGLIAYTGSHNIVEPTYGQRRAGPWIDLSVRCTGPVASALQVVFLEDWAFETEERLGSEDIFPPVAVTGVTPAQVVPTGPTEDSNNLLRVLLASINAARRRIVITSPYFVPDQATVLGLAMAAERGVRVDLVLPRKSDHPLVSAAGRAYFDPLLEAGVNIHLHSRGLLHAKTMTVDDSFALLGSSNLDIRSLFLNFELNVLLFGEQITSTLRFAQTRYLEESQAVDRGQWATRPRIRQVGDGAASLLSPLL